MTVVSYRNVKRPIIPVGDLPMLALFARGEQGAWYDPGDLSTMFQDAAGTVPVTSVEQPVGLILDKSGNGNHASQVTTTARPRLSARVNLLNANGKQSTDMETLVGSSGVTLVQMDGFRSAVRFAGDSTTSDYVYRSASIEVLGDYTFSFYVEMDDPGPPVFGSSSTPTADICLNAVGIVGKIPEHVIHVRGNIYRCIATVNVTTAGNKQCGPINYIANANRGFRVSGFQLDRGSVATKYQRVSTATDYDWQGWPLYLTSDGVDDAMSANGAGLAMDRDVGTTLACGYEYGYMAGVTGAANVVALASGTSAVVYARLGQRADHSEGRVASATMRNENGLTPAIATASVARNIKPNTFEVGVVRTREQTIRHRLRDGAEAVAGFTGDASLVTNKIDLFSPGGGVRRIFGALVVMRELDDSEVGRLTNFLTERATRAAA